MPYIVTTKRPAELPHGEHPHDYDYPESVSRRAVATLEGQTICPKCGKRYEHLHAGECCSTCDFTVPVVALPEQGGTVGPLPDGTVIEVEETTWRDLSRALDINESARLSVVRHASPDSEIGHRTILDAYNARQS